MWRARITGRDPAAQAITSPNGGFLRSTNWRRDTHWAHALKKTKLAPLTIHDLRHTYASLAQAPGADLRMSRRRWATQHPQSPRTSTAICTPTNSTRLQPTWTGSTDPTQVPRTDRNRTQRISHRVLSQCPCSSDVVARGGIEPPTFRFSELRRNRYRDVCAGQTGRIGPILRVQSTQS